VHWLTFVAGQDVVCLTFHFSEQRLKQLFPFSLYCCKIMKRHRYALTLRNMELFPSGKVTNI
jgi:hypothetical protein